MSSKDAIQRSILPIPDIQPFGLTTYDAKDPDTRFPPIRELRPPKGAPNVLVILIDDVGFGASSAFGGPCNTPNFEKLAKTGLKYNRFHTTALCSPTRQALLTGRNHHSVGMGGITEIATSAPGYNSVRPNTKAPLAETLKLNGYSTAQFGKCHEVPVWQTSPAGPFDAWPSGGGGFEYFYGFIGGENNQWDPALYEGTTPIEPPKTPAEGYHLTEDLTDKAIAWARQQKALMADKPFFMYFAPGATHAPHHVPREWIDKYKGKFAHGWDKQREITFEKQKALGVIPPDAVLTRAMSRSRPGMKWIPNSSPYSSAKMEVYAAFMEHTDYHIGRLLDVLEPVMDNTLIYLIIGDNGASAEGTLQGAFNEMAKFQRHGGHRNAEFMLSKLDEFGGEGSYGHFAVGWAWAMDTPYQWTKQVASHWGGTRNRRLCIGPGASRKRAACAASSRMSSTSRRRCWRRQVSPNRPWSTACNRARMKAPACCTPSTMLRRPNVMRPSISNVLQPRHLSQGLERCDQAPHALDDGRRENGGFRRRRLGTLRRQQGLDPVQ